MSLPRRCTPLPHVVAAPAPPRRRRRTRPPPSLVPVERHGEPCGGVEPSRVSEKLEPPHGIRRSSPCRSGALMSSSPPSSSPPPSARPSPVRSPSSYTSMARLKILSIERVAPRNQSTMPLRRSHTTTPSVAPVVLVTPPPSPRHRMHPCLVPANSFHRVSKKSSCRAAEWHVTRRRPRTTAHVVRRTRPAVVVL